MDREKTLELRIQSTIRLMIKLRLRLLRLATVATMMSIRWKHSYVILVVHACSDKFLQKNRVDQ